MGWVYYACYLQYFEVSRSDLIRTLWKSYRRIEDEDGLKLPVVEAGCKYTSGARYEDELEIRAKLTLVGGIRLHFDYEVRSVETGGVIATGFTVHCFIDSNGKPKRPPMGFMQFLES
ncbi:MAG: acyl-CoA thioesterase [bacterium]|nr:acyl-CoA thioesterase [bacterium]